MGEIFQMNEMVVMRVSSHASNLCIVTSSNFDTKGILIVILQVPISYKAERFCNTSEISKGSILNYDL